MLKNISLFWEMRNKFNQNMVSQKKCTFINKIFLFRKESHLSDTNNFGYCNKQKMSFFCLFNAIQNYAWNFLQTQKYIFWCQCILSQQKMHPRECFGKQMRYFFQEKNYNTWDGWDLLNVWNTNVKENFKIFKIWMK